MDSFYATIRDDVAVVAHEDQEHLDYFGQTLRSRFRSMDTWRRSPEGWRLIAQQTTAVLKDPPIQELSQQELCAYDGRYSLTKEIAITLHCSGKALVASRAGRSDVKLVPELRDVFFAPAQPRTRRIFLRDGRGNIIGFVDRREGEDVRWTKMAND